VQIINDVSGGLLDDTLFETVAELQVPYVLTHSGGLADASTKTTGTFVEDVCRFFAERLQRLYELGVADVILDPGFGFGKTLEQNYQLLAALGDLMRAFPGYPLLVGISRKSMIYRQLGIAPEQALNGTTVLHTIALQAGAHLLRAHDVREAAEAVALVHNIQLQKACFSHSESKI
jgi:dihydropteroate synthase